MILAQEGTSFWNAIDWGQWLGPSSTIAVAIGLFVLCLVSWASNAFGLPGNWFGLALVALYAWLGPSTGVLHIGWGIVIALLLVASLGELLEFVAGALGAQRAGASRKSIFYSMVGSIVGAFAGAFVGVPIPIVGSIVAAILFSGLGAAGGAVYGEWNEGKEWKENLAIANAAFWGRTLGTLGKIMAGMVNLVIVLAALLL